VRFEWDEQKDEINIRKHGVPFTTAVLIFEDPNCLTFPESVKAGETRWHAIGAVQNSLLFLTVVHTYTEQGAGQLVRIISARRATSQERRLYAQAIL
jgi:uncharacterized DUF497 family protein